MAVLEDTAMTRHGCKCLLGRNEYDTVSYIYVYDYLYKKMEAPFCVCHTVQINKQAALFYRSDLGVPEKEQKQTKMSGRFPDLKNFSGTNVLMIRDSV
jgi:hypothetical protein